MAWASAVSRARIRACSRFARTTARCSVPSGIFPEMSAPKSHVPSTRESAVGFGKSEPYSRPSSGGVKVVSSIAFSPRITAAASITASTMGLYPVQRQTLPCRVNHSLTSSRVGSGLRIRSPLADMMNPGEQKPHCTLAYVMNARCNG